MIELTSIIDEYESIWEQPQQDIYAADRTNLQEHKRQFVIQYWIQSYKNSRVEFDPMLELTNQRC